MRSAIRQIVGFAMNKRRLALFLATSAVTLSIASDVAFGQAARPRGRKPAPPRLTEEQQASASVAINPAVISKYVVPRQTTAVGGKDVVTLFEKNEVVDGQASISAEFDGQTYLFSNAENKGKFDAHPASFAPVLAGFSVVAYKETGVLVPGLVDQRSIEKERLYLFATAEEKAKFDADPKAFDEVDLILEGYSPVALVEEEVLRRGDKSFETIFEGHRVRFASEMEKEAFLSDPARYFPTLGGLDVASLATGKAEFGVPKFAVVYKNRLYSFANDVDRTRFVSQAESHSDFDVADGGNDPVALVEGKEGRKGHYGISAVYRGLRFLFVNEFNRVKFIKDPSKYFDARAPKPEVIDVKTPAVSTDPAKPTPAATPPAATEVKTVTKPAELPSVNEPDPNVIEPEKSTGKK